MSLSVASGPVPLTRGQIGALVSATSRELLWGRRLVSREIRGWRGRASLIADPAIRTDALTVLARKRGATDGAALFWTLLPRRDPALLRLLVAHELIWDFLDSVSERWADAGQAHGRQLHRAIVESLDPAAPISDYYRYHLGDDDDGGYLLALVETCRGICAGLPSYEVVRPMLLREGGRGVVQALNHEPDESRRDDALRRWVRGEFPREDRWRWFELTAAASAPLLIHALLALAAEPRCSEHEVSDVCTAYFPWVSLTTTMLDSYVDMVEDAEEGDHSYIAHYPGLDEGIERLHEGITRSTRAVRDLRAGARHAVIVSCMIAMYLSKDSARVPALQATTRRLIRAGGALTCLLVPVLRAWRIRHGQQSA